MEMAKGVSAKWLHISSVVALVIGTFGLLTGLITIAVPGDVIGTFLFAIVGGALATALANKRIVKLLALLLVLVAVGESQVDFQRGRVYREHLWNKIQNSSATGL